MSEGREARVAATFVELADTLVADFDIPDFLHFLTERCIELLNVSASGLLLADADGRLQLISASPYEARVLELLQLQAAEGPCMDAYSTGRPVIVDDLAAEADRWPVFAPEAIAVGCSAVHALPMRLRDQVIGGLNLFSPEPGALPEADVSLAQAMADIATIGILSERAIRRKETVAEQLQTALNSRILIEQAKGVLAERLGVDAASAFTVMRRYARDHNRRLGEVAASVVEGTLAVAVLASATHRDDPVGH